MPIVTLYDRNNPITSVESILTEFLRDFFPSSTYTITFESPSKPSKPTIWLQKMPSRNRDILTRRPGHSIYREELSFAVSVLSDDRATTIAMADTFKRHAVLASASALSSASLRYAVVTPFHEIIVESQQRTFRRGANFSMTIEVQKEA